MRLAQDILERPIALENASYYVKPPLAEMDELAFINAVLEEADCPFHVDVNNIYVNSLNHNYDAAAFLKGLKSERIVYGHVAGHDHDMSGMIIDTHGQTTCDPAWQLLELAYRYQHQLTILKRTFTMNDHSLSGPSCAACAIASTISRICAFSGELSRWFDSNAQGWAPLFLRVLLAYEFGEAGLEKLNTPLPIRVTAMINCR